jgi:hypothetical protein
MPNPFVSEEYLSRRRWTGMQCHGGVVKRQGQHRSMGTYGICVGVVEVHVSQEEARRAPEETCTAHNLGHRSRRLMTLT